MEQIPFSQIVGQERAIHFLKQAMAREKMPHAYLFVGIHGVGKTTTALALTQALNCRGTAGSEGCGKCPPCRQLLGGHFPDLGIFEPEGQSIKIEQIRELNRSFSFKPMSGRYRVTIVRRAETMTEEAANAFLKTLEEPPEGNILILCVTEPLDLLPTIVSRCQKVSFRPIPAPLIVRWLKERKSVEEEKALILAKVSEGSLGTAAAMCNEGFWEKREDYLKILFRLHTLPTEELLDAALQFQKGKRAGTETSERGDRDLRDMLVVWKSCFRDMLLLRMDSQDDLLFNPDFSDRLKKISDNYTIRALTEGVLLLDQAERDMLRGRNLDLMMENAVLSLKRLRE